MKSSLRKKQLNNYLNSKRKISFENEEEEQIKEYIINIDDIKIEPKYIIDDINNFNSNVIIYFNFINFFLVGFWIIKEIFKIR